MNRLTISRGGRHTDSDRLDVIAGITGAVLAFLIAIALYGLMEPLERGVSAFGTLALILMSAFLVASRGVALLVRHVVRPALFDREQRRHEIVPPHPERKSTRA